ncbi:hypothetical protein KC331_g1788 [Hortaea werneckii]|nr:hypothetical protein KC331_g1788 [Hortaea werneckii]KAI7721206.1 hypothetical protein KC353_g1543 [Hortaea werneckii]
MLTTAQSQQDNIPNPQAPSFTLDNSEDAGTGLPALQDLRTGIPQPGRGGQSSLPRAGGAAGRVGIPFQGAVGQQAQFDARPSEDHEPEAKRLQRTMSLGPSELHYVVGSK